MMLEDNAVAGPADETEAPKSAGFMKFYGLYWKKSLIDERNQIMAGIPKGWIGQGQKGKDYDASRVWMNFWQQKGAYVLYDTDLVPVYTGQAGSPRKAKKEGKTARSIGTRLTEHKNGKYRNGWEYFSWFGFLDCVNSEKLEKKLRSAALNGRRNPDWKFTPAGPGNGSLNLLLNSFEAILIEAFTPRFNSRGGNLNGAKYVDQVEVPLELEESLDQA